MSRLSMEIEAPRLVNEGEKSEFRADTYTFFDDESFGAAYVTHYHADPEDSPFSGRERFDLDVHLIGDLYLDTYVSPWDGAVCLTIGRGFKVWFTQDQLVDLLDEIDRAGLGR